MDTNLILCLVVGLSTTAFAVRALRLSLALMRGWIVVSLIILAVIAIGWFTHRDVVGYVAAGVWGVLFFLPTMLYRLNQVFVGKEDHATAAVIASFIRFLHPADGWWEQHRLFRAQHIANTGDADRALEMLDDLRGAHPAIAQLATWQSYRLREDWKGMVEWIDRAGDDAVRHDPRMALFHLRALGETGDLTRLIATFTDALRHFQRYGADYVQFGRLFVFSFCGCEEALERLLSGRLAGLADATRVFWRATAAMAAGDVERGRALLEDIVERHPEAPLRHIQSRLDNPVAVADGLSDQERATLVRMTTDSDDDETYRPSAGTLLRRAYVTFALAGANVAMYAIEWTRGVTEDVYGLYRLGALRTSEFPADGWWRVLTAGFLHYGPLHLILNMVALLYLGPLVERALGHSRTLVLVLASIAGSGTLVAMLSPTDRYLVGASGGVMALLGALVWFYYSGWRAGAAPAGPRLLLLLVIILIQVAIDTVVPQISALAHAGGAVIGFALAAVVYRRAVRG